MYLLRQEESDREVKFLNSTGGKERGKSEVGKYYAPLTLVKH